MASDHFKIKSYERSDRQKNTEHEVTCYERESESIMKFSSKQLESPPPKPPRRRYSDQLSLSSLGTYSCNKKHNEENAKVEPKLKEPQPAYLSLPTNLPSNLFNECGSHSFSLSASGKDAESGMKEANQLNDHVFQNGPYSRNSVSSSKIFRCGNQSFHKDCHRRHHSDPALSHFNLQNDSHALQGCSSMRRVNKFCDSCTCCKNSYHIIQEIRILKEINEKLWQHLCSVQSYVESMKKKTYDECTDVSISGLLSSVYYAQKAKDCAMEERLRIVLEERDAALLEIEDLIQFLTKSCDCTDGVKEAEKDIKELLTEMGCTFNPSKLLKHQRMLLAQIHQLNELKQDGLSHQLKQAVVERDNALDKVRQLEEEVKDIKLSYDVWHSDNKHWEFTIFDILNQLMHQRDTILSKIDNGLDIGNILYRPPLTGNFETVEASPFEWIESQKQKHSFGASDEVMKLKEEVLLLNQTLESERKKREQVEGKCVRLERLIHILRKKLNGQNIGVPV